MSWNAPPPPPAAYQQYPPRTYIDLRYIEPRLTAALQNNLINNNILHLINIRNRHPCSITKAILLLREATLHKTAATDLLQVDSTVSNQATERPLKANTAHRHQDTHHKTKATRRKVKDIRLQLMDIRHHHKDHRRTMALHKGLTVHHPPLTAALQPLHHQATTV